MQSNVSALWRRLPPDLDSRIEECIRAGCEKAEGQGAGYLFFRADDVAVPGRQFSRMMDLFSTHGVPLSLAVVPAMLTRKRWQYLKGFEKKNPSRWCWYQHGWRHVNYEAEGKKQEFGDARSLSEIKQDLMRGKCRLEQLLAEAFYPADIIQLEADSRDCRERVEQINRTALEVCEYLSRNPAVESVYYPAFTNREMYDRFRRPDGGYGGLFSIVLKDAAKVTEAFYDALEITKGPNLGTSFSLCCPFTLIAHYDELEWAESAGASRYLIRISVGLEPAEELITRIQSAIDTAIGA